MNEIASVIKVFMDPGPKKNGPAPPVLKPGTLLTGKITEIMPGGLLRINFGRFRTQARVKFPVASGDTLRFEVLEAGDRMKLRIEAPPPNPLKPAADRMFTPEDLQQLRQALETALHNPGAPSGNRDSTAVIDLLLSRLSTRLLPLLPDTRSDQMAAAIKSNLVNSGIFFEKRLETALLQIFKSPDNIHADRAASHPFITNIIDADLKPTLLKLVALLSKPHGPRDAALASILTSSRNLLDRLDADQKKLGRRATGNGRWPTIYKRSGEKPGGPLHRPISRRPAEFPNDLQVRLVRSGLWSDPDIRAGLKTLARFKPGEWTAGRCAPCPPAKPAFNGWPPNGLWPDTGTSGKQGIEAILAALSKKETGAQPSAVETLIKHFKTYIRSNRITPDARAKTALEHFAKIARKPLSQNPAGIAASGSGSGKTEQNLAALQRFIAGRTAPHSVTPPPAFKNPAPAGSRPNPASFVSMVEQKAAFLAGELNRAEKKLAGVSPDGSRYPDTDKLVKTARSLRALIGQHQLPAEEKITRALARMESTAPPATGNATAAAFKSGRMMTRLLPDLALLREFIDLQRTELNETLNMLRNLTGRTDTEAETGDRPGSEKSRPADPVQVVTFSLPMEEGKKPARLKVFYPLKQNTAGPACFRISLLLSMERMGPLRTDISAQSRQLDVKFSTETESARRHIDDQLYRLRELLTGPFETVNIATAVDEESITAFEYEDLEVSGNRLVNLKV